MYSQLKELSSTTADYKSAIFYVAVILSVAIAALLRFVLRDFLGPTITFSTYSLAVICCSYIAGFQGGMAATLLSIITVVATVFLPGDPLHVRSGFHPLPLLLFALSGAAISALGQIKVGLQHDALESKRLTELVFSIDRAMSGNRDLSNTHADTLERLALALVLDRTVIFEIDEKADLVNVLGEWQVSSLNPIASSQAIKDLYSEGPFLRDETLIVRDVTTCTQLSPKSIKRLSELNIRSIINIPFVNDQNSRFILGAYTAHNARIWTTDEVALIETVSLRIKASIEAQASLAAAQKRADRDTLIDRISEIMRTTMDLEAIKEKAVSIIGEALGVDRCYVAIYDLDRNEIIIGADYHRPDLPSIAAVYKFGNTKEMFTELYPSLTTSIIPDLENSNLSRETIDNLGRLQIRSRVSVAVADLKTATLSAAMADCSREWTEEDVNLIERVGLLLRSNIELTRAQYREQRITTELKAALLPHAPANIPNIQLAVKHHSSSNENEIGGDFFDIFKLDRGQYGLMIGDVSGKGFEAASQLAVVRNSLRTLVYLSHSPSHAVQTINGIITMHGLLNGFVTLFVAIYDTDSSRLSYTSCGHEPAMVRKRSSGSVELLNSSGSPLGVDENAEYQDYMITLDVGDLLLLYTDGIVEAGSNHKHLLGTEGLTKILRDLPAVINSETAVTTIIEQAKEFAGGQFQDDVCLIAAQRILSRVSG